MLGFVGFSENDVMDKPFGILHCPVCGNIGNILCNFCYLHAVYGLWQPVQENPGGI